jgi:hypothetical protein
MPPGTACRPEVGKPGLHISLSYLVRNAPVTCLFALIHTRLSFSPSPRRSSVPFTAACPEVPTTVTFTIRPETPRMGLANFVTVPMLPV